MLRRCQRRIRVEERRRAGFAAKQAFQQGAGVGGVSLDLNIFSVARAQKFAELSGSVDEAQRLGLRRGPERARKDDRVVGELVGPAFLDERDELRVKIVEDGLQALNVFRVFRFKRIKERLVFARRVDAAFDAEARNGFVKAETAGNDADGADDGTFIGVNLVSRQRQDVSARCAHILNEGQYGLLFFPSQSANRLADETRLHGRSAGRIDRQRNRLEIARFKRGLDGLLKALERQTFSARGDAAYRPVKFYHIDARPGGARKRQRAPDFLQNVWFFGHCDPLDATPPCFNCALWGNSRQKAAAQGLRRRLTAAGAAPNLRIVVRLPEDHVPASIAAAAERIATRREALDFAGAVAAMRGLLAGELDAVNATIHARLISSVNLIPDLAGHLVNAGGKRIRPMLTLAAARAFGYEGDKHVKLAAAVELIHGATLLHDDVVDASALRRGAETANIIWGNKESVLVGDFIFSRAFELMVAAENLPVLQVLSRAAGVIAEGEVLQLATQNNVEATFEMYIAVVEAKTAALFAGATQSGALIAGCDARGEQALKRFGRNFGVAYQLIDDALDYAGFETTLGKSVGDDFREGKMTLPVVYAIARAKPHEKTFWRRVISETAQAPEDFERACALMERDDAVADTIACARSYAERALSDLAKAPDNKYSAALANLVTTSVSRVA